MSSRIAPLRRIPFSVSPKAGGPAFGTLAVSGHLEEHTSKGSHRVGGGGARVPTHMHYVSRQWPRVALLALTSVRRYHMDIEVRGLPPELRAIDTATVALVRHNEAEAYGVVTEQIYRNDVTAFEAAPVQPRAFFTSEGALKIMLAGVALLPFRPVRHEPPAVQLRFRLALRRPDGTPAELVLCSQVFTVTRRPPQVRDIRLKFSRSVLDGHAMAAAFAGTRPAV